MKRAFLYDIITAGKGFISAQQTLSDQYNKYFCFSEDSIMAYQQYFTDPGHVMQKKQVYQSMYMEGAKTLRIEKEPLSRPFEGFGVCLTEASCKNLMMMDPAERRELLRTVYTEDGLGLSVARISIGSSDYSSELYSYDDEDGDTSLEHFSVERDSKYVFPVLKEVLDICPDLYIFASPWSPPGWMKTGGGMCGGYMREEYIECYADYIIRFLCEYESRGIHVSALTVQNEPENTQQGRMAACVWHPDTEARFVCALRKKLTECGMDTRIWLLDHAFNAWHRVKWQLDTYPTLAKDSGGVAFHYYGGNIEDPEALYEKYPQMEYHFTEAGPRLYDNYDSDWCKWVNMMSRTMACGYSTFCGWNLMLDEMGGPNIGPFMCGGLITRDTRDGSLRYSGQYRAFMQVSHFVRPGAKIYPIRVSANATSMTHYPKNAEGVVGCAAENTDGSFVLLLSNHNNDKRQVQFERDGRWYYVELLANSVNTVTDID